MENQLIYKGLYKDNEKEVSIEVVNDSDNLSFTLEGMQFISNDMEEWQLDDSVDCTDEQLEQFNLSSVTYKEGFNLVTKYYLVDCVLSLSIPQQMLSKKTAEEYSTDLNVFINLDREKVCIDLMMSIEDRIIQVDNIEFFENGLSKINKEIERNYLIFNCFNCRYSSYNVYGQGAYGSLLCYKNNKERFLVAKDKVGYVKAQEHGYELVQETSYCDEFQMPDKDQFLYK